MSMSLSRLLRGVRTSSSAPWVGATVLALFTGSVVFGLNATHGVPFDTRKTVTVEFGDVTGLTEGDDVRIASTRVGYVEDLRIEQGQAVAELKIDDESTRLYRSATASVAARSALGQKFVNIDPGRRGTGQLGPDATISQPRTQRAHEITGLLNVLDRRTRAAATATVRELGSGMAGRSGELRDFLQTAPRLLDDLGALSGAVAVDDGRRLVGLLHATDRLASRFTGREQQIAALNRGLGDSLAALSVDGGQPVATTLRAAPAALTSARSALTALRPPLADVESTMIRLRPGAHALTRAEVPLRGFLREGMAPLDKVPGVATQASPALRALTGLTAHARPVARQLEGTGADAAQPLAVMRAYRHDIAYYFGAARSALAQGDGAGNWLRIHLIPRSESATGPTAREDPTVSRHPYPAPGQAPHDSAGWPVNGGTH